MSNTPPKPWKREYVPDIVGQSNVDLCKRHGWFMPVEIIAAKVCTGGCGRERGMGDECDFFTCHVCKKRIALAKRDGAAPFKPLPIDPVRHDCIGECGRYGITCKTVDRSMWHECHSCCSSIREFMRKMNGEKKKINMGQAVCRSHGCKKRVK